MNVSTSNSDQQLRRELETIRNESTLVYPYKDKAVLSLSERLMSQVRAKKVI